LIIGYRVIILEFALPSKTALSGEGWVFGCTTESHRGITEIHRGGWGLMIED